MKPVIAANWKMNLDKVGVDALINGIQGDIQAHESIEVIIAPSSCYLAQVGGALGVANWQLKPLLSLILGLTPEKYLLKW